MKPSKCLILLVGAGRFELPTPSPPDWCANQAALRSEPLASTTYVSATMDGAKFGTHLVHADHCPLSIRRRVLEGKCISRHRLAADPAATLETSTEDHRRSAALEHSRAAQRTYPENGHAHSAYLLAAPVARHSASRIGPLHFYGAVERG